MSVKSQASFTSQGAFLREETQKAYLRAELTIEAPPTFEISVANMRILYTVLETPPSTISSHIN